MSQSTPVAATLRCTAFEEFMLDQDSPNYPCVITMRAELKGALEPQRLSAALDNVIEQHPLLRARLQCRFGKLHWNIDPPSTSILHIHQQTAPAWPKRQYFDLSQEYGVRADLFPTSHPLSSPATGSQLSWILFLQVHHAVADGLGCFQILQDWLTEYARPNERQSQRSVTNLRERNRFGLNIDSLLRLMPKQLVGLAGVRQFLSRHPVPMSPRVISSAPSDNITSVAYRCTASQSQQLKQDAKQRHATLNDWLASLVFEACDQYRQMQMSYRGDEWLRMMVPMSLRDPQSNNLSACNVVSCIFLDRTGEQISDREELLKSIHDEMELIKVNRLAFVFIFSLWLRKIVRWRIKSRALVASPPTRCQTSIVFSNMGRLFESATLPATADGRLIATGITLESCEVLAPIAPLMRVAITAYQYAGRISLSLRYDSSIFSEADAQRLMGLIVQRIEQPMPEPTRA